VAPRFSARRTSALLLAVLLLAGCTTQASEETGVTTTDLAAVKVTGAQGKKPSVDVQAPFAATKTTRRVLVNGSGRLVAPGQRVTVDFLGVNGTDNREFTTTYGLASSTFTLDAGVSLKGVVSGLTGVTVGSRVLIAVPPVDGYGTVGNPTAGIGPTDTMVLVVDVKSAEKVLTRATGKAVKPAAGLPKVTLDRKTGEPSIKIPGGKPPEQLVSQVLIQGSGSVVKRGDTMIAHYVASNWRTGKVYDSRWSLTAPPYFVMGDGKVLAGWDEGLLGKRVGSQVMLILPPEKAFGAAGKPENGIRGTDTVVIVVDILDSAQATKTP
jgi:peptidylprolyl isomerase